MHRAILMVRQHQFQRLLIAPLWVPLAFSSPVIQQAMGRVGRPKEQRAAQQLAAAARVLEAESREVGLKHIESVRVGNQFRVSIKPNHRLLERRKLLADELRLMRAVLGP